MELAFLLLSVIMLSGNVCSSSRPLDCKEIVSKSPLLRLKKHLFCEYDSSVRPILQNNSTINVTLLFMPKFMEFDDHSNTLSLHLWLSLEWTDDHLKWNVEDFDQVDTIRVKSDELWIPDFSVYDSGNMDITQSGIPSTDCIVNNKGEIFCVPAIVYTTQCMGNYALWPYDKQNCTIRFGSWSHTGEEIDFHLTGNGIILDNFAPHPLWNIQRVNVTRNIMKYKCCPNDTFPYVVFELNMKRHSRMIHAVYITPAIVMLLLTLTVTLLDSRSYERVALSSINFICHLLIIYSMHYEVPLNGINIPHIVIFYRNSLALAAFVLVVTTLLRKLQATSISPPQWVNSVVAILLNYRAGQFLLINSSDTKGLIRTGGEMEDNAESMQSTASATKEFTNWRCMALIFDWSALLIVLFTYCIMFIVLIPISNEYTSETSFQI